MPELGDPLFKQSAKAARRGLEGSWFAYAQGYKLAGDELAALRSESSSEADAYPVVFLYRHFIELELKSIFALLCVLRSVQDGETNSTERVKAVLPTHDLIRLCERCRVLANHVNLHFVGFPEQFNAFAACVKELADHDPGSFSFRYPTDKELNPTLTRLAGIDLKHLKAMVDKIGSFLGHFRAAAQAGLAYIEVEYDWTEEEDRVYAKDFTGQDEAEAEAESEEE